MNVGGSGFLESVTMEIAVDFNMQKQVQSKGLLLQKSAKQKFLSCLYNNSTECCFILLPKGKAELNKPYLTPDKKFYIVMQEDEVSILCIP